jgi:hypothetical protein
MIRELPVRSPGYPRSSFLYLSRLNGLDFDADADCLQIGCSVDSNNIQFDITHDFQEANSDMARGKF